MHIYNLSVNNDSSVFEKSNHLIRHYVKTQQICPLWVIPNGLTLGEINMLFSSLPSSNQKEIVNSIKNKDSDISIKNLFSFSGDLEIIRNLRNVINHYEPVFPYLCDVFESIPEKLLSIIVMLKDAYNSSTFVNNRGTLDIQITNFNKKKLQIIEIMKRNK